MVHPHMTTNLRTSFHFALIMFFLVLNSFLLLAKAVQEPSIMMEKQDNHGDQSPIVNGSPNTTINYIRNVSDTSEAKAIIKVKASVDDSNHVRFQVSNISKLPFYIHSLRLKFSSPVTFHDFDRYDETDYKRVINRTYTVDTFKLGGIDPKLSSVYFRAKGDKRPEESDSTDSREFNIFYTNNRLPSRLEPFGTEQVHFLIAPPREYKIQVYFHARRGFGNEFNSYKPKKGMSRIFKNTILNLGLSPLIYYNFHWNGIDAEVQSYRGCYEFNNLHGCPKKEWDTATKELNTSRIPRRSFDFLSELPPDTTLQFCVSYAADNYSCFDYALKDILAKRYNHKVDEFD